MLLFAVSPLLLLVYLPVNLGWLEFKSHCHHISEHEDPSQHLKTVAPKSKGLHFSAAPGQNDSEVFPCAPAIHGYFTWPQAKSHRDLIYLYSSLFPLLGVRVLATSLSASLHSPAPLGSCFGIIFSFIAIFFGGRGIFSRVLASHTWR